jgi:hypothetical protein
MAWTKQARDASAQARAKTVVGLTAEQHMKKADHHTKIADRGVAKLAAKNYQHDFGGGNKAYYNTQTRRVSSVFHKEAAEHLSSGKVDKANEAAKLAVHHEKYIR